MGTTTVAGGLQQTQQRSSNPGDYIVAPKTSAPDMMDYGGSSREQRRQLVMEVQQTRTRRAVYLFFF
jgi:hypothetical protein